MPISVIRVVHDALRHEPLLSLIMQDFLIVKSSYATAKVEGAVPAPSTLAYSGSFNNCVAIISSAVLCLVAISSVSIFLGVIL